MLEYEHFGHMELVTKNPLDISQCELHFLPHHAAVKPSSFTAKIIMFFKVLCKTSCGKSQNSILVIGLNLQRGILEILFKFWFSKIVLSMDTEKMYR